MKPRLFFYPLVIALVFLIARSSAQAEDPPPPAPQTITVDRTVQGYNVDQWHAFAARYRRQLIHRWQPTVRYALRLASAVFGVSYWQLRSVSYCESRHYVYARNGRYKGLFQLGWHPFGFSAFDPVASALSAAATVRHDGSWRQWECRP